MQRKVAEVESGQSRQRVESEGVVGERCDPRVERTRRAVLEAARELLADGGLEALTVPAVAERSGVNKTTVYRNWPDPQALVREALGSIDDTVRLPDSGSVRTDLVTMFTALARSLQRPPWDRLLPSVIAAAAHDETTRAYHGALTRARRDGARVVIERGIVRGELDASTEPTEVVESIVGPIYYRILMTREPVRRGDVERLVDRAIGRGRS